jgi:cytochrome c2
LVEPTARLAPSPAILLGALALLAAGTIGLLATRAWLSAQEGMAVARALTGGDPARAPALLNRYGCGGCHTIPGMAGADGQVGPVLRTLRQRVYIAGSLPNTAPNLVAFLVDPQRFRPRSAMPVTGISADEARDVAAWLYAR